MNQFIQQAQYLDEKISISQFESEGVLIEIVPLSGIIKWRYKPENTITYQRLYNYSKQKWIGE